MGDAGSPYGRFQRALRGGDPYVAWTAALEVGRLSLADALALLLVLRGDDGRFPRAAARWHGRWVTATSGVATAESMLVLGALCALAGPREREAAGALAHVFAAHGQRELVRALGRDGAAGATSGASA